MWSNIAGNGIIGILGERNLQKMRKLLLTGAAALALAGCTRYEPVTDFSPAPAAERQSPSDTPIQTETGKQAEAEQ